MIFLINLIAWPYLLTFKKKKQWKLSLVQNWSNKQRVFRANNRGMLKLFFFDKIKNIEFIIYISCKIRSLSFLFLL